MRVVGVIQARSGSSRFPGKVLADLHGHPVLAHVIDRLRRARSVDEVVVATTALPSDDRVARIATKRGAAVVRGSENDVLARFVTAACEHAADVVVRITADCPLLDARLVDIVVARLIRDGADYATNVEPPTFPDGYDVEAMTIGCLTRLDAEARLAYEREHVTARAREHPESYRTARLTSRRDLSHLRLTVDYPKDLRRVALVLEGLPPSPPPGLGAVLARLAAMSSSETSDDVTRDERYQAERAAATPSTHPS